MPRWLRDRTNKSGLVVASLGGHVYANVPDAIRTQLQYLYTRLDQHTGGVPYSLGLTSAVSGEGVTFIGCALGAVLAQDAGHSTCILSANWWKEGDEPDERRLGLADVLSGEADFGEVLIDTRTEGLSIIPAGSMAPIDRAHLATWSPIGGVLDELRGEFSHVIVDMPAIATSAAALAFGAATDATLLVTRQRMTRIDQVERAVADLRHTSLLGIILNDSHVHMPKMLQRRLLDA